MSKCGQILPEAPYVCARESEDSGGPCCSACLTGHTLACNVRTFGKGPEVEYYGSPTKDQDILARLAKAVVAAEVLQAEFKTIRNISLSLGLSWGGSLESLLAHLEIDLKYLGSGIKGLIGR